MLARSAVAEVKRITPLVLCRAVQMVNGCATRTSEEGWHDTVRDCSLGRMPNIPDTRSRCWSASQQFVAWP